MDDPPCYIDKLPSELLYSITEHLEDKDKRALRLMNKKLCAVASKGFCFESVTISPSNESIYQLISVATCDFWRTQVKHIDWVLLAGDPKSGLQAQLVEFQQDTKFNQDVVKRYLKPLVSGKVMQLG